MGRISSEPIGGETRSFDGKVFLMVVVIIALIVMGLLVMGPISSNMASIESSRSNAVQAQAWARTETERLTQQTIQQADRLRAEAWQEILSIFGALLMLAAMPMIVAVFITVLAFLADRHRREVHAQQMLTYILTHPEQRANLPPPEEQPIMLLPSVRNQSRRR